MWYRVVSDPAFQSDFTFGLFFSFSLSFTDASYPICTLVFVISSRLDYIDRPNLRNVFFFSFFFVNSIVHFVSLSTFLCFYDPISLLGFWSKNTSMLFIAWKLLLLLIKQNELIQLNERAANDFNQLFFYVSFAIPIFRIRII